MAKIGIPMKTSNGLALLHKSDMDNLYCWLSLATSLKRKVLEKVDDDHRKDITQLIQFQGGCLSQDLIVSS